MAVLLATYDLKKPGKNYQPVYDYFKKFDRCKGMESVWLLDTNLSAATVRDELSNLIDSNDIVFVVRLSRDWGAKNYQCGDWLNHSSRNW